MNKFRLLAWAPALAPVGLCLYFASRATPQAATDGQTKEIVAAASVFLNSLDASQRAKVQFTFTPQKTATDAKFKGGMGGRMTFVGAH
jgi:hypothetical protein